MAEELVTTFCDTDIREFKINSVFYGKVTHLEDPYCFYVLPNIFNSLLAELELADLQLRIDELKKSTVVIYYSHTVNGHIRGKIAHISQDYKCVILAIDNGFIEEDVTSDRIFHPANEAAIIIPGLTKRCELYACMPRMGPLFDDRTIQTFRNYMYADENVSIAIRAKMPGRLCVTAYNNGPDDASSVLISANLCLGIAILRNPGATHPAYPEFWRHNRPKLGEKIQVRVQSGSSLTGFFVCTTVDYNDYLGKRDEFTSYCRSLPQIDIRDFRKGKSVGVMLNYGEPYERAIIMNITEVGTKARVRLIDWGREAVIDIDKIKSISEQRYGDIPVRALYCSALPSHAWDNHHTNFLHPGFEMDIIVKWIGNEFDFPHIVFMAQKH